MECDVEGPCTWDATEKSLMKAPERKEERVMRDVVMMVTHGKEWKEIITITWQSKSQAIS
jgi:hypothetical protein